MVVSLPLYSIDEFNLSIYNNIKNDTFRYPLFKGFWGISSIKGDFCFELFIVAGKPEKKTADAVAKLNMLCHV